MKKRLLIIMYTWSSEVHLTKDPCSYAYALSKYYNWDTSYAYFSDKEICNANFEKHCNLIYLGNQKDYKKQILEGIEYLKEHAKEYSVLMLFNYGTSTYHTANAAKKYNSNIKIWCKLDMSEGGFSHFYDGTLIRKIKSSIERFKNRNIDLFTVENKYFYHILNKGMVFKNRIKWLPNGVSLFQVSPEFLNRKVLKENIIISVGRLGSYQKNNQMLIQAIERIDKRLFKDWKVYFIGNDEGGLTNYLQNEYKKMPWLKEHIKIFGLISNREELYSVYAKAKILCMTSRREGFSMVPVEGMFFGTYLILTNYGTVAEEVTDYGKYGKIVPLDNIDALVRAIEKTIQTTNWKEMCIEIQNYARKVYNYKFLAGNLDGYLSTLLTDSRSD